MAEEKIEGAKGKASDEEKPPGYYKPDDPKARPGIDVCEKCITMPREYARSAPIWGCKLCWKCWRPNNSARIGYAKFIMRHKNALAGANLSGVNLSHANLEKANLQNCRLGSANLDRARLHTANLNGASLAHASITECNARFATLIGADLMMANLQGSDFTAAELTKANLGWANLRQTLLGANLEDANLGYADLTDAYLDGAKLNKARLRGVRLDHSGLAGTQMFDADFRRARLNLADISDVKFNRYGFWKQVKDGFRFWWIARMPCSIWLKNWKSILKADLFASGSGRIESGSVNSQSQSRMSLAEAMAGIKQQHMTYYTNDRVNRFKPAPHTSFLLAGGIETCIGNPLDKRYFSDISYVEALRERRPRLALLWLITCYSGKSFLLWAFWCLVIAFGFAWLYDWNEFLTDGEETIKGFWDSFYFSIVAFTTLGFGDIYPSPGWGRFFAAAEVILGYIGLGGLISILANKVARRA